MLNSLFIRFDSRGASDWKVRPCGRHGRVEIGCDEEGLIYDKRLNILDVIPPFPTPFVMARMNLHWFINHHTLDFIHLFIPFIDVSSTGVTLQVV